MIRIHSKTEACLVNSPNVVMHPNITYKEEREERQQQDMLPTFAYF